MQRWETANVQDRCRMVKNYKHSKYTHTHICLTATVQDYPGEQVPEETFTHEEEEGGFA